MLNQIPSSFEKSEEGGWDKFTLPKVQKWIQDNLYGKRTRILVAARSCSVNQDPDNPKPDEWNVTIEINGVHTNYCGMGNRLLPIASGDNGSHQGSDFGDIGKATFTFKCNEAEARKWDAQGKVVPTAVQIEGDIAEIALGPHMAGTFGDVFVGYDTFVRLDNVVVTRATDLTPAILYAVESSMGRHGSIREPDEAITEMKALENDGKHYLVFMKYWHRQRNDDEKAGIATVLLSFPLIKTSQEIGVNESEINQAACNDPAKASEIAKAKTSVGWAGASKAVSDSGGAK